MQHENRFNLFVMLKLRHSITILLVILLLIPCVIFFYYAQLALIDYSRYVSLTQYSPKLSIERFHFYFNQAIDRDIVKLTSPSLTNTSLLPTFELTIAETDIAKLNADLPRSGREQYVTGYFRTDDDYIRKKVDIRYRGGMPNHWFYTQKSFRIKFDKFQNYFGESRFNLINPPNAVTCLDCVSYDISREFGILTPDFYPIRLFLNNEYHGLYLYLSQIEESFLRKNHRMPGSIYNGDMLYGEVYSSDGKYKYRSYGHSDKDGSLLWKDPMMWQKAASRNSERKSDRRDINKYIEILSTDSGDKFHEWFNQFFDKQKMYKQIALDQFFGSIHRDYGHNHKLYFDPYKGKFEPFGWDFRFWSGAQYKDTSYYPLIEKISMNPILEHERDLVLYNLLNQFPIDKVGGIFDKYVDLIANDLRADKLRDYVIDHVTLGTQHAIPLTDDIIDDNSRKTKILFSRRYKFLEKLIADSKIAYSIESHGKQLHHVNFIVDGNTAVDLNFSKEFMSKTRARLYRDINFDKKHTANELVASSTFSDILYPGRIKTPSIHREMKWVNKLGGFRYTPNAMVYTYILNGLEKLEALEFVDSLVVSNAITNEVIELRQHEEEQEIIESVVHPWGLKEYYLTSKSITLSGNVEFTETFEFSKYQNVYIAPGTDITLHPGVSLIFYGKLIIDGNPNDKVNFHGVKDNKPWGAIVLQGKGGNDSRLSHFSVSGGSVTTHNLIDYPGQLNVHDLDSFNLSNCHLSHNYIGDDNLHIAYSKGSVDDCVFVNSNSDAIDIDISEVDLSNIMIIDSGNDGVDSMDSDLNISQSVVYNSGDKCLSAGEDSTVHFSDSILFQCEIGVASKDGSIVELDHVVVKKTNSSPLALYNKNPLYDLGGTIKLYSVSGFDMNNIDKGITSKMEINDGSGGLEVDWMYFKNLPVGKFSNSDEFVNIMDSIRKGL